MKKYLKILVVQLGKLIGFNEVLTLSFLRVNLMNRFSHRMTEVKVIENFFSSSSKNKKCLIDVGAHTGAFFENFLWKRWKIYAFEPDPNPIKNSRLKKFAESQRVTFSNYACSNRSGETMSFYSSEESTGISSLHPFHSTHKKICDVTTITLADYIIKEGIKDVDLLKIDTEGHDLFVLEGFPWDKIKPKVVFCEFEDKKTLPLGYDYRILASYLNELGYKVFVSEWYPVIKYGGNHKWRSLKVFPCELADKDGFGNFLCFRDKLPASFKDFLLNVSLTE